LKNEQRPPRHTPEQQLLLPLHISPSTTHVPFGSTHTPPVQALPQHWTFDVHAPPAMVHVLVVPHVRVAGSQKSEQHSLDSAQPVPAGLHWFGPLQRFLPSMS
jgi:hypothetical protein